MKETNMSRTTFSGPVKSGTIKYNQYKNTGTTVLKQIQAVPFNTTLTSTVTNYLPSGCQLLNIVVDVLAVFDSATSATLSVGKTAGGTNTLLVLILKQLLVESLLLSPLHSFLLCNLLL